MDETHKDESTTHNAHSHLVGQPLTIYSKALCAILALLGADIQDLELLNNSNPVKAFIADFMARPAFAGQYNSLGNQNYVDTLINMVQVNLFNRQSLIDGLNNSTLTRAQVLRQIVESSEDQRSTLVKRSW